MMYSRLTSVSTQRGGRPTIVCSGDVSLTRQHSIIEDEDYLHVHQKDAMVVCRLASVAETRRILMVRDESTPGKKGKKKLVAAAVAADEQQKDQNFEVRSFNEHTRCRDTSDSSPAYSTNIITFWLLFID